MASRVPALPRALRTRAAVGLSKAESMIANRANRGVAVCRAIKAWEKMQPELYDMFKTGEMVLSEPVDVLTLVEDGKAVLIDVRLGPDFSEVSEGN